MYSDHGNDGVNYFSGGGFMPSQSTAVPSESQYNSASRKSGSANQALLPLTVKQISLATLRPPDDTFIVDGQEVSNVTLVGLVSNKEEKVTDVAFVLDDGTGKIEVKRWIDPQENYDLTESSSIRNNTYLRVHGHLRSFQGKGYIHAFSTRPITDFNEVTFHFLECIYVHVYNTKSQGTGLTTNSSQEGAGARTNVGYMNANNNFNQYAAPSAAAVSNSLDECQRRVKLIFDDPANLTIIEGLHVDAVASKLPGFDKKRVREAIDFLVNEGLIYSSIDDDHFKSINSV